MPDMLCSSSDKIAIPLDCARDGADGHGPVAGPQLGPGRVRWRRLDACNPGQLAIAVVLLSLSVAVTATAQPAGSIDGASSTRTVPRCPASS